MIDVVLMHHLLSALRSDTTLVLVGDSDQLPSVGPGNVLADLINSGKVPFVKLDEIFRQARSSLIVTNAHLVNQGRMPEKDTIQINYQIFISSKRKILKNVYG